MATYRTTPDQGVVILVEANDTTMLRFNCFDIERSYVYGPEGKNRLCRMDPTVDGNPIMWSVKQIRTNLQSMLTEAGYEDVANSVDMDAVKAVLDEVESTAREVYATGRNTVKHNRGHDIFEAGNIRFGLELRKAGRRRWRLGDSRFGRPGRHSWPHLY